MASSPNQLPDRDSQIWFCHECNHETQPLRLPDPHCLHCHSTFVEEVSPFTTSDDHPSQWASDDTRIPPDPARQTYPSPPIPSTRQRYEEEQRSAEYQPNFPEMLGPLLNLFGIHNFGHNPNPASERADSEATSAQANRPPSPRRTRSNLTETSSTRPSRHMREGENSNETDNASIPSAGPDGNSGRPANRPLASGVYTFTFGTDGTRANSNQRQGERPANSSLFSFIQHAMGQPTQRQNSASTSTNEGEGTDPDRMPPFVDEFPQARWTDDGDHLHNTGPPPPPRSEGGAVNLEEGHPLREFISLISSIVPPNNTGYVFGAGVGGTPLFTTGGGGHFGDYVFSDMGMQDVVTQLMNMAGAAGSAQQPIPASEKKIKSLRRFKIDPKDFEGEAGECAICKDSYEDEDECMELPCKHVFHAQDCITPWLEQNGTCPVCRFSLVDDPSDDPEDAPLDSQGSGSSTAQGSGGGLHGRTLTELAAQAAERRNRAAHETVPDLDID